MSPREFRGGGRPNNQTVGHPILVHNSGRISSIYRTVYFGEHVQMIAQVRVILSKNLLSLEESDVPIIIWDTRKGSNNERIGSRNRTVCFFGSCPSDIPS